MPYSSKCLLFRSGGEVSRFASLVSDLVAKRQSGELRDDMALSAAYLEAIEVEENVRVLDRGIAACLPQNCKDIHIVHSAFRQLKPGNGKWYLSATGISGSEAVDPVIVGIIAKIFLEFGTKDVEVPIAMYWRCWIGDYMDPASSSPHQLAACYAHIHRHGGFQSSDIISTELILQLLFRFTVSAAIQGHKLSRDLLHNKYREAAHGTARNFVRKKLRERVLQATDYGILSDENVVSAADSILLLLICGDNVKTLEGRIKRIGHNDEVLSQLNRDIAKRTATHIMTLPLQLNNIVKHISQARAKGDGLLISACLDAASIAASNLVGETISYWNRPLTYDVNSPLSFTAWLFGHKSNKGKVTGSFSKKFSDWNKSLMVSRGTTDAGTRKTYYKKGQTNGVNPPERLTKYKNPPRWELNMVDEETLATLDAISRQLVTASEISIRDQEIYMKVESRGIRRMRGDKFLSFTAIGSEYGLGRTQITNIHLKVKNILKRVLTKSPS